MNERLKGLLQEVREIAYNESGRILTSPINVASLVMADIGFDTQENFWVLNLETNGLLMSITKLYRGSKLGLEIRNCEVFRDAIIHNAKSVILVHNHPSGNVQPSPEDISTTMDTIMAGKLLDIEVLDHLIVGKGGYTSMREKRLCFFTGMPEFPTPERSL